MSINTISDNLIRLNTAKNDIATAITNKGGTVSSGDGFEDFANDIATIPSGGGDIQFSHGEGYINSSSSTVSNNVNVYSPSNCSISGTKSGTSYTPIMIPIITTSSNVFICIPVHIYIDRNVTRASVSYNIPSTFPSRYGYNANTKTLHSYYKASVMGTVSCTVSASTFNFFIVDEYGIGTNEIGDFILKFDKT